MCGIAGTINLDAKGSDESCGIARMLSSLAHRGPDGEGIWRSPGGDVWFGHRRLAIVDLSEQAGQPMVGRAGNRMLSIVFNGEIYNFMDIRRDLERSGFQWNWMADHSDTEVLLAAWAKWGLEALGRLEGMFAFAIHDSSDESIHLVRDRFGKKPLYWTRHNRAFHFASEIKALLAATSQRPIFNRGALSSYLMLLAVPEPETMFSGIFKLPAGHFMRLTRSGDGWSVGGTARWWNPLAVSRFSGTREEAVERTRDFFMDAVRKRLVGDVPVGVFLSGGIDSSAVAKAVADSGVPLKTYTIGFDLPGYPGDESAAAKSFSSSLGGRHKELVVTRNDILGALEDVVWHQDEPVADPVCIPGYLVSRLAAQDGSKIVLVGEGADEMFHGYDHWRRELNSERLVSSIPRALSALIFRVGQGTPIEKTDTFEKIRRILLAETGFYSSKYFPLSRSNRLLAKELRTRVNQPIYADRRMREWHTEFLDGRSPSEITQWMTFVNLKWRLPELLLMRIDKMSMAWSIETRAPYLDHRLGELALSLPANIVSSGQTNKPLLRAALAGLLPKEVLERRKIGFGMPMHLYEIEKSNTGIDALDILRNSGLFDPSELEAEFRGGFFWPLMNLALWIRKFNPSL